MMETTVKHAGGQKTSKFAAPFFRNISAPERSMRQKKEQGEETIWI